MKVNGNLIVLKNIVLPNSLSTINSLEILLASRTYFVRTDGSDTNNGLTNTSTGAFKTIQRAINAAYMLYFNGFTVTVQIANGTYNESLVVSNSFTGGLTLLGDTTTPSNVIISGTISLTSQGLDTKISVAGIKFTGSSRCLLVQSRGQILITGKVEFGASTIQMLVQDGGTITVDTGVAYDISGGGTYHCLAQFRGALFVLNSTVTLTGTPNFTGNFVNSTSMSQIRHQGTTFSGSATGSRFNVANLSHIATGGGGANYFPGDVAGTTDATTFGLYT